MNNTFKYLRVRSVHVPTRGTEEAAGIDFYVPEYDAAFLQDLVLKNPGVDCRYELVARESDNLSRGVFYDLWITLMPHAKILIPSGIKTYIEPGTALIAANKSGVGSKKGLAFLAQVVDSDYAGEVHLSVVNTTDSPVVIKSGEKLIQFIHTPVILSEPDETDVRTFNSLHEESKRGELGFGSGINTTNKN